MLMLLPEALTRDRAPVEVTSSLWKVSALGIITVLVASSVIVPPELIEVLVPRLSVVSPVADRVVSEESTVSVLLNELSVSVPA